MRLFYYFSQHGKTVCSILDGLQFAVTKDNCEAFDAFTLNYNKSELLDNILVYCGRTGYFSLLSKTIDSLTRVVFDDGIHDDLLAKTVQYYSTGQIETLGKKLVEASSFKSGHDYKRELAVLAIISPIEEFANQVEKIAERIMSQLSSYYNYEYYREYASLAMGA